MSDSLATHRPESGSRESAYRAVIVDAQNTVVSVDTLQATQLEEAALLAQRMAATSTVYLWEGVRFVQRFERGEIAEKLA